MKLRKAKEKTDSGFIPFDTIGMLKAQLIKSLTNFSERPLGTIEDALCDWNTPSAFANNYTPQQVQKIVIREIEKVFDYIIQKQEIYLVINQKGIKMKELYERIKRHEGFSEKPYDDATGHELKAGDIIIGTITWGYGFTDCKKENADKELEDRVLSLFIELSSRIDWFGKLPYPIKFILTEMAYQMGIDGVLGFKEMLKHLENAFDGKTSRISKQIFLSLAADEMLKSDWHKQTPKRCEELAKIVREFI